MQFDVAQVLYFALSVSFKSLPFQAEQCLILYCVEKSMLVEAYILSFDRSIVITKSDLLCITGHTNSTINFCIDALFLEE